MERFIPDIERPETEGELNAYLVIQRQLLIEAKADGSWNRTRQAQVNLDFLLDQMLEVSC